MKTTIIYLFLMLQLGILAPLYVASAQNREVGFQVFYDELSPYGTWIENTDYGFVWLPNVASGFSPYNSNGHWVYTDYGWTWFSDYSWGWAPFHYGRWYDDAIYGPIWVPGNEWAPAWVSWRRSDDYYGWAAMRPGMDFGNSFDDSYDHWTFVRSRRLGRHDIHRYYIRRASNVTIIHNTTIINTTQIDPSRNHPYNPGPDRAEVEKHTRGRIVPVTIKETDQPGQRIDKGELQMYRPPVRKNSPTEPKQAPTKVSTLNDVKTPAQRKAATQQDRKPDGRQMPPSQRPNNAADNEGNQRPQANDPAPTRGRSKESPQIKPPPKANDRQSLPQAKPSPKPAGDSRMPRTQQPRPNNQPKPKTLKPKKDREVPQKDNQPRNK